MNSSEENKIKVKLFFLKTNYNVDQDYFDKTCALHVCVYVMQQGMLCKTVAPPISENDQRIYQTGRNLFIKAGSID